MKRRNGDITRQILTPILIWGSICLQAGLMVVTPVSANSGAATKKEIALAEVSSKKATTDQIEVAAGREFKVTLASNATTGYHWELAAPLDEAIVKLVNSEYQAPKTGLIGSGGHEIWTFRAVARGQTVIKLKYVRPWEKEAAPAETATYKVTVR